MNSSNSNRGLPKPPASGPRPSPAAARENSDSPEKVRSPAAKPQARDPHRDLSGTRAKPVRRSFTFFVALALAALPAFAQPANSGSNNNKQQQLAQVLGALRPNAERAAGPAQPPAESPRVKFSAAGDLTHLAAPPGHAFQTVKPNPGNPEATAQQFLKNNAALLGIASANADTTPLLTRKSGPRTYVRLQQTYRNVPVFAAQAVVQLNAAEDVEFLSADLATDVNGLDAQPQWATPAIDSREAANIVSGLVLPKASGAPFTTTTPILTIYAPGIIGNTGPLQLVWDIQVNSEQDPELNERWFINAGNGQVALTLPLSHSALNRWVSDSSNTTNYPGTLVRIEGGPATGITDVDNAYLFLGQTYNFYNNNHSRDSWDDSGGTLFATTRWCPAATNCPWGNAQWTGSRVRFGNGYATDDVVGHEYTHAVTEFTSGLVYANQSGAINESLSDCFGEFVDLSNANGNDNANVRWLVGEDLPGGSIRNMQFPTNRSDPDRLNSSFYVPPAANPANSNDFGGVHSNSGVNNKLCYLLVDGDEFNNQTIYGMGIAQVADLYYEANANLLTSGSGWSDLYEALSQGAVNLGWSVDDRNNLYRACVAVEIASPDNLYVDWDSSCLVKNGRQTCNAFLGGPFQTVVQGVAGAQPGDQLYIRGGNYNEAVTFSEITTVRSYNGTAVIGE